MITSYSRGHKIYFDTELSQWLYLDTNELINVNRPCALCGKNPTVEGHDYCIGKIDNATSACCGHGIYDPYIIRK